MASVGVLGIGLIGGSIAKGLPEPVVVFDADAKSLELARAAGLRVATNLAELVNTVDVLFIGVPFDAFDSVFAEVQAAAVTREKPIVVTNVLSVMLPVAVTEPNVVFIAGHPMAGTEHSGFEKAISVFNFNELHHPGLRGLVFLQNEGLFRIGPVKVHRALTIQFGPA